MATELGLHEHTVGKWRPRFLKDRCDGSPRPTSNDDDQVAAVTEQTSRTTPVDALDGGGSWLFPHHDPPDVYGVRLAAAP